MAKFIADFRECFDHVVSRFSDPEPVLLSRIGGSDTRALADYLRVRGEGGAQLEAHIDRFLPLVASYNGFFDKVDPRQSYLRYCDKLIDNYLNLNYATLCNGDLLTVYFSDILPPHQIRYNIQNVEFLKLIVEQISARQSGAVFMPYNFIERILLDMNTMFKAFSKILDGRKVLVVSPFSESIMKNFKARHDFFGPDFRYPEFEIDVVDVPITYSGLSDDLYEFSNWFETAEDLKIQISEKEFDIALMSCGTYAMPIGDYIFRSMKKSAIYVGGVMQLFFGVMGRRYNNPYFLQQIRAENFIYPVERERYMKMIPLDDEAATEAFGAYF